MALLGIYGQPDQDIRYQLHVTELYVTAEQESVKLLIIPYGFADWSDNYSYAVDPRYLEVQGTLRNISR